jgi:hypothetical protein
LPDSIIYIINNIINESYQSIFNEYKELVNFINNSHASTIAEIFFKMLKNNKYYLHNINKSESIRQFLNHFEIEKVPAEKIVKAMSNLNEDSKITTNSKIKNFENYFKKNEIKFQTFIEKK